MNKEFLYDLIATPSPSGAELNIQKKIISYLEKDCDFIRHHSNALVSYINQESSSKIMLAAHVDEIGLMISKIDSNGLCHVIRVGGVYPATYIASRVQIITKNGIVKGIFGNGRAISKDKIEVSDLLLDIGVDDYESAAKLVSVGDYVVHDYTYDELAGNRLAARALDDRIGAFICVEALKKVKELKTTNGVYVATTVGEETTMRGASFVANIVKPTLALVVDVTFATDVDGGSANTGTVKLGGGPVLDHSSIVNKKINALLEKTAAKHNISLQYDVAPGRTGTDADKIHFDGSGIPVALVSIPLRYMHSCSELCDMKDVMECIDLISHFLVEYDENTNLNPFFEE